MKSSPKSLMTRLAEFVWLDSHDIGVLFAYNLGTGLLALAIPLASQALVNSIAQGLLLQPVIVLSSAVLAGLVLAGCLRLLQMVIVEYVYERILARLALNLAQRIPLACPQETMSARCNRFLEVASLQKSWSKLLLDVPGALVEILVSLALLSLYGPSLLLSIIALLVLAGLLHLALGWGGLSSGLKASKAKYATADWLQDVVDCRLGVKLNPELRFWSGRTDESVVAYLKARRRHFAVLFRQSALYYLGVAITSAGVLGMGGALVLSRQLSLGQLVAAELVVLNLLKALEKLVKATGAMFDLLVGLQKVAPLTDLPLERTGGKPLPRASQGLEVRVRGLRFTHHPQTTLLDNCDLQIPAGAKVALLGINGSGKSTLVDLLCGTLQPQSGSIELDGYDLRELELASLRAQLGMANDSNELLETSLEENILLGRQVEPGELRRALETTGLDEHLAWLPQGLATPILRRGRNLSRSQWQRIMLTRAVLGSPRLLILDEPFTGIDEPQLAHFLDAVLHPNNPQTVLLVARRPEAVRRCQAVHILHEGVIAESGPPGELAARSDSLFHRLFPECARNAAI